MNKKSYIQDISSYLNDGFVVIPSAARKDLENYGTTINDLTNLVGIAKDTLSAIASANRLFVIPEGVLSNIKSYIENARSLSMELASRDESSAQNALSNMVNHMEQIIAQASSYLNLADSANYQRLDAQARSTLQELTSKISDDKKISASLKKSVVSTEQKSKKLLERISSGILSENFKRLRNSPWNYAIMTLSLLAAIYAFLCLVQKSNEVGNYLVPAFESGKLDYRILFVKWSTSLPYIILLSIAVLELRNRVRNRDTYLYRENVAGSLDGYTESLLNKVNDIKNQTERDRVRAMVINFMIDSMLELTKSPTNKNDKHSLGLKVKDIGEATITN